MRDASRDRGDTGDAISAERRNDFALAFGLTTTVGLWTGLANGLLNGVDVGLGVDVIPGPGKPIRCCDA